MGVVGAAFQMVGELQATGCKHSCSHNPTLSWLSTTCTAINLNAAYFADICVFEESLAHDGLFELTDMLLLHYVCACACLRLI